MDDWCIIIARVRSLVDSVVIWTVVGVAEDTEAINGEI